MKTLLATTVSIIIGAVSFASAAYAKDTKMFKKPEIGGNRLDLCLNWGSGCGKPAADAWCVSKGFSTSVGHEIAYDIGASTPTRIITSGAICNQDFCDGFKQILCLK